MKKKYIIVGDNNYWYATTDLITKKELEAEIKRIKKEIKMGPDMFSPQPGSEPTELFAYPTSVLSSSVATFKAK
jgi:hypothetical protein